MPPVSESWASTPGIAKSMRSNRGRDTALELRVRRAVYARGVRYRVDFPPLPGLRLRADLVFIRRRIAVYLDGCFWHGCPLHGVTPIAHPEYWIPKLARTRERDLEATRALEDAGWSVLRFWEHDAVDHIVDSILNAVEMRVKAAVVTPRDVSAIVLYRGHSSGEAGGRISD
jgi:DNA mismatch endonuclease (patch repair protein)